MGAVMFTGRKKPYTARGIVRMKCQRCSRKALFQWNCCANGNRWVPVCEKCDIALNKAAMEFFRIPNRRALLKRYENMVIA